MTMIMMMMMMRRIHSKQTIEILQHNNNRQTIKYARTKQKYTLHDEDDDDGAFIVL